MHQILDQTNGHLASKIAYYDSNLELLANIFATPHGAYPGSGGPVGTAAPTRKSATTFQQTTSSGAAVTTLPNSGGKLANTTSLALFYPITAAMSSITDATSAKANSTGCDVVFYPAYVGQLLEATWDADIALVLNLKAGSSFQIATDFELLVGTSAAATPTANPALLSPSVRSYQTVFTTASNSALTAGNFTVGVHPHLYFATPAPSVSPIRFQIKYSLAGNGSASFVNASTTLQLNRADFLVKGNV